MTLTVGPETRVDFIALDADGHALRCDSSTYAFPYYTVRGPGDITPAHAALQKVPRHIRLAGIPQSLLALVFLTEQRVSYPVEVVVGLPSFAAQPVQLTELQYDGSSPLEIEVLQIKTETVFRVVEVNVKNKSNKGILRADSKMLYHDRTGTVLQEQSAMLTAHPEPGDSRFALVRAKTTRPAEATAFFATDALSSVTFVLERVRFVDGTEWIPPAGN